MTIKNDISIISGRSNEPLARSVAELLNLKLTPVILGTFSSGENRVEILESVRNRIVYIFQSGYTYEPDSPSPNDYIMETIMLVDACFRASAKKIVLVMPTLPYANESESGDTIDVEGILCQTDFQRYMKETIFSGYKESSKPDDPSLFHDIKVQQESIRESFQEQPEIKPFSHPNRFKLIAKLLQYSAKGVSHLLTVSLPRAQLVGYFDIPVDDLPIAPVLRRQLPVGITGVAVSDIALAKQGSQIANLLGKPFILLHRLPRDKDFSVSEDEEITCNDHILFIDEMGNDRVFQAAQQLQFNYKCLVSLFSIHFILKDPCKDLLRIQTDSLFDSIILTNSIRIPKSLHPKVKVIDLSDYLMESIKCIHFGNSLKALIQGY